MQYEDRPNVDGFGGNCFAVAIALQKHVFPGARFVLAINKYLWDTQKRVLGHCSVLRDGRYYDQESEKKWVNIESWGMLDPELMQEEFGMSVELSELHAEMVERMELSLEELLEIVPQSEMPNYDEINKIYREKEMLHNLVDTREFYPKLDPVSVTLICESVQSNTIFEQADAWQKALDLGYERFQGFYGRTLHQYMLPNGVISQEEDYHRKTYIIEWDTDGDHLPELPTYFPALYRLKGENDRDYWERACDYLSDLTGYCITGVELVPSISEINEYEYELHDWNLPPTKYVDLGEDGILLIADDQYIVSCNGSPLYVYVERDEDDNKREYITLSNHIVYLDTMKSVDLPTVTDSNSDQQQEDNNVNINKK
jgi:hypothetical protein